MIPFHESRTRVNLARAFSGECQAGMRYQMISSALIEEKLYKASDLIKNIAKNETVHATTFFSLLTKYGESENNVDISAGYPFKNGTLAEKLKFASDDEKEESEKIYPEFSKIANEEGYPDVAEAFKKIATIEGNHRILFSYLAEAIEKGSLYKNDEPLLWICGECGYMTTATSAPETCPVCKKEQGYFELHLPFDYMGKNAFPEKE